MGEGAPSEKAKDEGYLRMKNVIDVLKEKEEQFVDIEEKLSDPELIKNKPEFQKMIKAHSDLREMISAFREYRKMEQEKEELEQILNGDDNELKTLAESEKSELDDKIKKKYGELLKFIIPKDPRDEKDVIMEIRGGAGGEEAALFATELFRMYSKYAEKKGWKLEIADKNQTEIGGLKEIIFTIEGKSAFGRLKYESGVHRVQRVPKTEASGRIHTSTVTVAVLAEADEIELNIEQRDLKIDVFRSTGPGGQSVNTTDSAVRITHIPTGMVVVCRDERSQLKNKNKAMKILRTRLLDVMRTQQEEKIAKDRKTQVGTGERSEKIRTYNYPQSRITDHRIGLSMYDMTTVLDGGIDVFIDALAEQELKKNLAGLSA